VHKIYDKGGTIMRSSRYLAVGLVFILLLTPLAGATNIRALNPAKIEPNDEKIVNDTGVIKIEKIESGGIVAIGEKKVREIYVIYGDKGTYAFGTYFKKYLPVNINKFPEFKKEGLRVRFTGKIAIRNAFDAVAAVFASIMQKPTLFVGGALPIQLVTIERLSDENEGEETNHPPVADFIYGSITPVVDEVVKFIDKSYDPDGDELSYLWNFGDGSTSDEQNPEHVYESPGTYEVTLKVTDEEGLNDSITKEIEVAEQSEETIPVALIYGTVTDENDLPVSNAVIKAIYAGDAPDDVKPQDASDISVYKTKTDENGNYELKVNPGAYTVVASKEGYVPSQKMIKIRDNERKEVNFVLKKLPVKKEGLVLDVILKKREIPVGESIIVKAVLTNNGDKTVRVCDMGLKYGTLDFLITTPDGKKIHYIGPILLYAKIVELKPGDSISTTVDLTKEKFGVVKGSEPYTFDIPGKYSIVGIYKPCKFGYYIPIQPIRAIGQQITKSVKSEPESFILVDGGEVK